LVGHALEHRDTVRIGRTHGQYATPDVWGHRVADFAFAADRARDSLRRARDGVLVAKLSGTTGTYQQVPVEVEAAAAEMLGLRPVEVATQVVMRDRLAEWMFALASIAAVCEAIALEIRLGQRSEVAELAEGAGATRVGSSSMPHKANPITSEKIGGLARLVRAYLNPVPEGVALWHERDLTHSSVERIAVPDAAALTEHIVCQAATVMSTLVVDRHQMRARAKSAPVTAVSNAALVRLADAGLPWSQAWTIVQHAAKQDPAADAAAFVSRLRAMAATEAPTAGSTWADGLDQPDPIHLDAVFDRLLQLRANTP
jgi:adenylosuccinate lyase